MVVGVGRDVGHGDGLEALERARARVDAHDAQDARVRRPLRPSSNEIKRCVRLKTIMT